MSISLRKYIRWLPDEASEPTSTIVVTSPQRRFVDIRVLLPLPGSSSAPLPLGRLDWAIAGTSSSWMRDDGKGGKVSRGQWRHWVDSRTSKPEDATDEGDNYPQDDGTTLEKGAMVNPATGKETEYEEVWIDVEPRGTNPEGAAQFLVVQTTADAGNDARGSVVRVGHICQGFLKQADKMVAERWEWSAENGWEMTVAVSHGVEGMSLPIGEVLKQGTDLPDIGTRLNGGGLQWEVIEKSQAQS